jgi:hypothetical protein
VFAALAGKEGLAFEGRLTGSILALLTIMSNKLGMKNTLAYFARTKNKKVLLGVDGSEDGLKAKSLLKILLRSF